MRRCRYRRQQKAYLQRAFTAIAANIERLSRRPPTAFQNFLDQRGIPRPRPWRSARD